MRALSAFGKNDLRSVRRDSLLVYMMIVPWLMVLLFRLVVPGTTAWLADSYSFDLVPYYPLLISFFFVLEIPMLFGVVLGLLVLDERDDHTLMALQVTPVSMGGYAFYRIVVAIVGSVGYIFLCVPLSGLMALPRLLELLPVALMAGLLAPVLALALAAFARNKLEGLALMKGFGILMLGPLAAYFIDSRWQLLMGLLPSYWPAKAYWQASAGQPIWPYILAGLVYFGGLTIWLLHRFRRKLTE